MRREPRYQPGRKIGGRYRVHQALMGGMGEVYLCLDEQSMLPYALKTFQGSNPSLREIFEKEVSNWVALEKHPNIVQCFFMERYDNIPFMVLEWVAGDQSRGTDLRSWLRRGPLDLVLALRFTIDICRGLQHAGEKVPGIVHRDLKPDNVLVNQSQQAKITDFGLATVVQQAGLELDAESGDSDALRYSQYVGNVVGTPPYMAPEQWRGEVALDARTDMYAVGCILYELLTGRWPYTGQTLGQLQQQHLAAPIPQLNGDFPVSVSQIVARCLAKTPEERYELIAQLLDGLNRMYETLTGAVRPEVTGGEFTALDYSNRGATYGNLERHERAIADYDRAIELDPGFAQAYYNRGTRCAALGWHERAIADFDRAIELDLRDAQAYSNRGTSYAALGWHERAIADFDRAIELDPRVAQAYFNRGTSYATLGQHERAIADFDRAIELDPRDAQAYSNRGNTYAALGRHERAIADCDQALTLDPCYANAWLNKGAVLGNQGNLTAALPCFEKAAELGEPRGAQYAAQVQQTLGMAPAQPAASDPQATFEAFQRAESLDAMRQAVQQFPILMQMFLSIEQVIPQQVPPEHRHAFEQRLAWLRQVAGERGGQ
jgi:tetratricopeptide (TPR) repeat protein